MRQPLMIELYAGLFGWSAGARAEGWRVVGFDIVDMCKEIGAPRPDGDVQLVLQDVRTLHGSQFRDAALIVASPPCQRYSYMAMPFSRGKAQAAEIRADSTGAKLRELNELFDACFRLQMEASEAAGRYIPMVVENVKGAQPWVGKARWHFGSYYLWGDVPALMPMIRRSTKNEGGSWFNVGSPGQKVVAQNPDGCLIHKRDGHSHTRHLNASGEHGLKVPGIRLRDVGFNVAAAQRYREHVKNGNDWFGSGANCSLQRRMNSKSDSRKAASAQIAKIPEALSLHIARVFKPR